MKKTVTVTQMMMSFVIFCTVTSLGVHAHGDEKHEPENNPMFTGMDTNAAKVVKQFHQALNDKDASTVMSVLSEDVLIYESGHAERSAAEYGSGHMHADMKYLAGITSVQIEHHVMVNGNIAISTSRSKNTSKVDGNQTIKTASETIVLTNIKGQWLITHIHWS